MHSVNDSPMEDQVREWNFMKYKRFVTAYGQAVEQKLTTFTFDGDEYYTPYAKYLIQYLGGLFKDALNGSKG